MSGYSFSPAARHDIVNLWDYIAEDDVDAADRVRDVIFQAVASLAAMPGMGHRREDLADENLRTWTVGQYLIVYRPETDPLEIVRIVSGYRDIAALLE